MKDTTVNVDPETDAVLDAMVEHIQPKTNKKELIRFLVRRYKEELGILKAQEATVG